MHRHYFKFNGYSGHGRSKTAYFSCKCGERRERKYTTRERRRVKPYEMDIRDHSCGGVHTVWHDFARLFMTGLSWRWKGYALMRKVERWAKRYPDDVQIVWCDDNHHAGSSLVLIDHKGPSNYMGVTVVFIPQFGGDPAEIFLYPCDRDPFIKALQKVARGSKPILRKEHKRERLLSKNQPRW